MENFLLAHTIAAANTSDTLAIGSSTSALIFAMLFTAGILLMYLLLDRLPRFKKNKINKTIEPKYIKIMLALGSIGMVGASLDAWWHVAIGRDNFWVTPHLFLYASALSGTILSFYVWLHNRDIHWKHILFSLLLFPIAGAFDNFFHVKFGSENLVDPKMMPWSPPHMLLILAALSALIHLMIAIHKYQKTQDFNFFGNLSVGIISLLLLAIAMPFHPTEAWGQIAGFAGAGVLAFIFIGCCLVAQKMMKGSIDAAFSTIFMVLFFMVSYGKEIAPQIEVFPHDRPPGWLFIFAYLFTAVMLDLSKDRFPLWLRGLLAGTLWSSILFGFSSQYMSLQFQYGPYEIATAITFSALAGLVVASVFSLFHLDDEKHINKMLSKF